MKLHKIEAMKKTYEAIYKIKVTESAFGYFNFKNSLLFNLN